MAQELASSLVGPSLLQVEKGITMFPTVGETILHQGYVEFPIEERFLRPRLEIIRSGMERITEDPGLAKLFPWRVLEEDHYGKAYAQEVGLVLRTDDEHKWIFHYAIDAHFEDMPEVRRDVGLREFFDAHRELDARARENVLAIAASVDILNAKLGAYNGSMVERFSRGRIISRDLRYLRAYPGKSDAFPHLDRGGITNHWGASQTGLMVHTPFDEWKRIDETTCSKVGLFPGRKFGAISHGKLGRGTLHGVKYDRLEDVDRYSHISFAHPVSDANEAAWLLERDAELKAYERSFSI